MRTTDRGLEIYLPPLKARAIDPLVKCADGAVRALSELEPSYTTYLEGQRAMMAKSYRATVLMRPDVAASIVTEHQAAEARWPDLLLRGRDAENLRRIIKDCEPYAAAASFDVIREIDDRDDTDELIRQMRLRALGRSGISAA